MAKFVSNLAQVVTAQNAIGKAALQAACIVVQNQAKMNVRGGFTTGLWVTGNLMRSIAWDVVGFGSKLRGFVGTPVDYGAFWEFGHHRGGYGSARSGGLVGYYRVPWLEPAMQRTLTEQKAAARIAAMAKAKQLGVALNLSLFKLAS